MIFHADSESDLKSNPNLFKNAFLVTKIKFLWYVDLKFVLWLRPAGALDYRSSPRAAGPLVPGGGP